MPRPALYPEEKKKQLLQGFLDSPLNDLRDYLVTVLGKKNEYFYVNPGLALKNDLQNRLAKIGGKTSGNKVIVSSPVELPPAELSLTDEEREKRELALNKNREQAQKAKNSLFSILAFKINEEIQNIKEKKKSLMSVKELVELIKLSKIELREPVSLSMTVNQEIKKEELVKSLKQFSWLDVE